MNIGIVCYASVGGSGIVATELGKALARRGHQVHFISTETPFRLGEFQAGLAFHQVLTPTYPLFREPQYLLSLSNKIVQVAREFRPRHHPRALRRAARDRRVPVAAGAGLVGQGAARRHHAARDRHHPGWQRPVVLADRRVFDRAIRLRDGGVGKPAGGNLRGARRSRAIKVIPNFLDCGIHRRHVPPDLRRRFSGGDPDVKIVTHVSNFRPVKRIDAVLAIFNRIRAGAAGAAAARR